MKPLLILRHIAAEGPGYLGQVMERHGLPFQTVAIDKSERVPDNLEKFSGLVLMGGPMSANDSLPWIRQELSLIREAVSKGIPALGHCLGAQLISKALGGTISTNPVKEIGWHEVETMRHGVAKQWLQDIPDRFMAFHWHGETFTLPDGATPLLTNCHCTNQAFVLGNTLALQCHVEMTGDMVHEWLNLYQDEFKSPTDSLQSPELIKQDAENRCRDMQQWADKLYEHWLQGLKMN